MSLRKPGQAARIARARPSRLIVGGLLGLIFLLSFWLTRGNANSGIFIFLAVAAFATVLLGLVGRSATRGDLLVVGLLLISLLTPWSVEVIPVHSRLIFGWSSPAALLFSLGLLLALLRRPRGVRLAGLVLAAASLVGWVVWIGALLTTSAYRRSGFPFIPTDLIGEGWYVAALALVIKADRLASHLADDDRPLHPGEIRAFSLLPGLGLVRIGYRARGRLWLFTAAFLVFLAHAAAVAPQEFQFYAASGSLPPTRPRTPDVVPLVLLLLLWLGSGLDTWRKLGERLSPGGDQTVTRPR